MTMSASRLGALGALDEAAAVMRAAGIDAFAAAVGERGRAGAAEQARQPAGQIAADHVAVLGVGRPAPDQLGEDRRAPGERALQRVFEVEQAEVILASLADDDPPGALLAGRRTACGPSASSWRCSALVKVETHTVPPDCSAHSDAGAR